MSLLFLLPLLLLSFTPFTNFRESERREIGLRSWWKPAAKRDRPKVQFSFFFFFYGKAETRINVTVVTPTPPFRVTCRHGDKVVSEETLSQRLPFRRRLYSRAYCYKCPRIYFPTKHAMNQSV